MMTSEHDLIYKILSGEASTTDEEMFDLHQQQCKECHEYFKKHIRVQNELEERFGRCIEKAQNYRLLISNALSQEIEEEELNALRQHLTKCPSCYKYCQAFAWTDMKFGNDDTYRQILESLGVQVSMLRIEPKNSKAAFASSNPSILKNKARFWGKPRLVFTVLAAALLLLITGGILIYLPKPKENENEIIPLMHRTKELKRLRQEISFAFTKKWITKEERADFLNLIKELGEKETFDKEQLHKKIDVLKEKFRNNAKKEKLENIWNQLQDLLDKKEQP